MPESKEKNKFGDHYFNKILFSYNGTKLEQIRICTYDKNHKDEIENYIFSKKITKSNNNSLKTLQISSHFDVIKNVIIDPIAFRKSDWSYTENSMPEDIYDEFYKRIINTNLACAIIDGSKNDYEKINTEYYKLMNEFYDLNTNNFNGVIGAYKNPYIKYQIPQNIIWSDSIYWDNLSGGKIEKAETYLKKYFKQLKKKIINNINNPEYLHTLFEHLPKNVMMTINVEYSGMRCDIIYNPSDIMIDYLDSLKPCFYKKTLGFKNNKNNRAIYRFYNEQINN